jgi:carbon storage regulator
VLVLCRQLDESIIIGDDIVVTVVDIRGDKVRLGITAPQQTTIHRDEIYAKIHGLDQTPRIKTSLHSRISSRKVTGPAGGEADRPDVNGAP